MEMKAEYLEAFHEEAADQLREWEQCLLVLEQSNGDVESLNTLFRAIHTLKGSAGFIEFDELQRLAHGLESALSKVRDRERSYDIALGDMLFEGLDLARAMIDRLAAGKEGAGTGIGARVAELLGRVDSTAPQQAGRAPAQRSPAAAEIAEPAAPGRQEPAAAVQQSAAQAAPAQNGKSLLVRMMKVREGSSTAQVSTVSASPVTTSILTVRVDAENREGFLRSAIVRARLERLGTILSIEPDPEQLAEAGAPIQFVVQLTSSLTAEQLVSSINVDQVTVAAGAVPEQHTASPAMPAQAAPQAAGPAVSAEPPAPAAAVPIAQPDSIASAAARDPDKESKPEEVVRVSVQKLDTLLNLVGELVIQNSGFISTTQQLRAEYGKTRFIFDLEEKTEALSMITRDLQDGIMKARMLPIANVFNRFRRVVRDVAKASGKSVNLEVSGEETEIDKKVIDRIGEPLVHLIRNAVDHGLEQTDARVAAGKSATGTVRLSAYQEGDHICIEVSDDGRGLDRSAILKKAIEKGLISADDSAVADEERVLGFIFLPGFSTARTVSDISGRGVGMDAVKRAVEEMNGTLKVRSVPAQGTTVTIALPLTMAIVSAVLVEAGRSTYAIPISAVREIVKTTEAESKSVGAQRVIMLRNEVLVIVNLAKALQGGRRLKAVGPDGKTAQATPAEAGTPRELPIVVVDFEGRKIGLEVETIVGSREVVIKSLSRHYREVEGLIGASILGNGKIALIVDVQTMIEKYRFGGKSGVTGSGRASIVGRAPDASRADASARTSQQAPTATHPVLQPAAAAPTAEPSVIDGLARDLSGKLGRPLDDANNQGAVQASIALSQLTGRDIQVSFPESKVVAIQEVGELLGGEENVVGGIFIEVQGDISGGILLVIPEKNLLLLDNLLHRRSPSEAVRIEDIDMSGISELGNILASCFINAMADAAHLAIGPGVPEVAVDMCLPIVDSVIARFNQPGERILLTEADIFSSGEESVVCHQALFLEPESMRKLIGALAAPASMRLAS